MTKRNISEINRAKPGVYFAIVNARTPSNEIWKIWRGISGRWRGESENLPGRMIDAPTLRVAKYDLEHGFFVECASAGL